MTSVKRVFGALNRTGYDRIPVKHEGTPEVNRMLMQHFGIRTEEQLLRVLGDDFRYVRPRYCGPELRSYPDDSVDGFWGERYGPKAYEGGVYLEPIHMPFAGIDRIEDLDRDRFPKATWFDCSAVRSQYSTIGEEHIVCIGSAGDMDFLNTIGRMRGMQRVMEDVATEDPVFLELVKARFRFYYELDEALLQAGDGMVDIVHVGEDLGNQHGPSISIESFDRLFADKYAALFHLAHSYGAKTMMHMCGDVSTFLPRLIELGLDIFDVVQPTSPAMDIERLQTLYGHRLAFCGSMCVQSLLPFGSEEDVIRETRRRLELFSEGGCILGPTHAIQAGTPIENILAMYRTAGSLMDPIDPALLDTEEDLEAATFDRFKLF